MPLRAQRYYILYSSLRQASKTTNLEGSRLATVRNNSFKVVHAAGVTRCHMAAERRRPRTTLPNSPARSDARVASGADEYAPSSGRVPSTTSRCARCEPDLRLRFSLSYLHFPECQRSCERQRITWGDLRRPQTPLAPQQYQFMNRRQWVSGYKNSCPGGSLARGPPGADHMCRYFRGKSWSENPTYFQC